MFKYKSPLSRILDGTNVPNVTEEETVDSNVIVVKDSELSIEEAKPEAPADEVADQTEIPVPGSDASAAQAFAARLEALSMVSPEGPEDAQVPQAVDAAAPISMDEVPEISTEEPDTGEAEAPRTKRSARIKTTFLGFGNQADPINDILDNAPPTQTDTVQGTHPIGWLVITNGPGRGTSVMLKGGLMQIGRNDDQSIQLDFGDNGISRSNHAVIAYDAEARKCYLGHGGKANLVRLNSGPVLSTVSLTSGDCIRISETTMRFVAFCDEEFDWQDD